MKSGERESKISHFKSKSGKKIRKDQIRHQQTLMLFRQETEIQKGAQETVNPGAGAYMLSHTWDAVLKKSDSRGQRHSTTAGGMTIPVQVN